MSGSWTNSGTATAGQSSVVSPLTPNTQYDFEVTANNAAGSATSDVVTGTTQSTSAPSQPTGLTITAFGSAGATFSWTASTGTATITYQLQYEIVSTPQPTLPPTNTPPGAVTNIQATATSSTIQLSWAAPSTGTTPFTYNVSYKLSSSSSWQQAANGLATTNYTLTGLAQSSTYDVQIVAVDPSGLQSSGATKTGITTQSAVVAVGSVTTFGLANTSGNPTTTSIEMAWAAPATGQAPFTYSIAYKASSDSNYGTPITGIAATAYTVTGLAAGTSYDFEIQAVDNIGTPGPWSTALGIKTATAALPAPPTQVGAIAFPSGTSSNPTTSQMTLAWNAPPFGTSPYLYNIAWKSHSDTTFGTPVKGLSSPTYAITGLTANEYVDVSVVAVDAYGQEGQPSIAGPWITAATDTPVSNETSEYSPPVNDNSSSIINSIGEVFSLSGGQRQPPNYDPVIHQVTVGGVVDTTTISVVALYYRSHRIWRNDADNSWWVKVRASGAWVQVTGLNGVPVGGVPAYGATPGAIVGLGLNAATQTSMTLLWAPPSTGSPPYTYTLAWKLSTDVIYGAPVSPDEGGGTQYTISGLTTATSYDVQVSAFDYFGRQGPWTTGTFSTTSAPPPPPTPPPGGEILTLTGYSPLGVIPGGTSANFCTYYSPDYYDSASGAAICNMALSVSDTLIAGMEKIFGYTWSVTASTSNENNGTKYNILFNLASGGGAIHHYGIGDIVITDPASVLSNDLVGYLVACEIAELYSSDLSGLTDEDVYAFGEGLSRYCAGLIFPKATFAADNASSWLNSYTDPSGVTFLRPNTLDVNPPTVAPQPNGQIPNGLVFSATVHFLNWLRHKGYTHSQIMAAINSVSVPANARQVYNVLAGTTSHDPYPDFLADVNAVIPSGTYVTQQKMLAVKCDLWQTPW